MNHGYRSLSALVIAGTSSSVGKTSITLGLVSALTRRGMKVQPFKVGPDYLDPTYLSLAARRTCFNLDPWMMGSDHVRCLFERAVVDADVAIVEGVMGLHDGVSSETDHGSTAHIAELLKIPIVLTIDASGMGRTMAALVQGCLMFSNELNCIGVVANRVGSQNHEELLRRALTAAALPPLVGAFPKRCFPNLSKRDLGLVTAYQTQQMNADLERFADACEMYLHIDELLSLSKVSISMSKAQLSVAQSESCPTRIAVADDEAFHFIYPDNLQALQAAGASILRFSPLTDRGVPEDADAVYFPGGYPELYAKGLADNTSMCRSVKRFAEQGRVVYGECGGLMYLGEAVLDGNNKKWSMAGVIPLVTAMCCRSQFLGYNVVVLTDSSIWGEANDTLRGHAFHYSEIIDERLSAQGWRRCYRLYHPRSGNFSDEGFSKGNILASYVHLHWAASPKAVRCFLNRCRRV